MHQEQKGDEKAKTQQEKQHSLKNQLQESTDRCLKVIEQNKELTQEIKDLTAEM